MPSGAVYLAIGVLAAVENILPLLPADTAVALGAFMSNRGLTSPLGVFVVTWVANCGGATGVYAATWKYGRGFTEGPIGRRLLSPRSIATIEREYARFGTAGIFLSRFLPGVRAVVPAFAGLVHLSPARALTPIFLASAIWYGTITALAAKLGAEWSTVARWISNVNRSLGLFAVALVVVVAVVILRRRGERRRTAGLKLRRALEEEAAHPHMERDPALRNAAALVLELVFADEELGEEERQLVEAHLIERWDLERPSGASPAELAAQADQLTDDYTIEDRARLLHRMWRAALRDGPPNKHQQRLLGRAAALLAVSAEEAERVARESWSGIRVRAEGT